MVLLLFLQKQVCWSGKNMRSYTNPGFEMHHTVELVSFKMRRL